MAGINDLMRRLEMIASKADRVNFEDIPADEIEDKLPLPRAPLKSAGPKIFPTREEAKKRDKDKKYDEAQNTAEEKADQIQKWLEQ
jgi:hypothetical protein